MFLFHEENFKCCYPLEICKINAENIPHTCKIVCDRENVSSRTKQYYVYNNDNIMTSQRRQ